MRSSDEICVDNFEATISEALRKLSIEEITTRSNLAKLVIEFLKIETKLSELRQPISITITGAPREAIEELQGRVDQESELEESQNELVLEIVSEFAESTNFFAEALIAHLTGKPSV